MARSLVEDVVNSTCAAVNAAAFSSISFSVVYQQAAKEE
jgi:hypothetical protein